MKFKLICYGFSVTPLGNEKSRITLRDVEEAVFDNKDDLYAYVRNRDNDDFGNPVLSDLTCDPNGFPAGIRKCSPYIVWCGKYLVKEDDRIIDLRDYLQEIEDFDLNAYNRAKYDAWKQKFLEIQAVRRVDLEKSAAMQEGEFYWSYYRKVRTAQERRCAADPEMKPFIRPARNLANLPTLWDEDYFLRENNWKARNKKARKQWQVNLPKHCDIIEYDKKDYASFINGSNLISGVTPTTERKK